MLLALLLPDPCDPHRPEEFKSRARALLLAAVLFLTKLPGGRLNRTETANLPEDEAINCLGGVISVVAAFAAGVFWVLSETNGNFGPYFVALFSVTGLLTGGLGVVLGR